MIRYHYQGNSYVFSMKHIEKHKGFAQLQCDLDSNIFSDRKGVMRLASLSLVNLAPTVSNSPLPTEKWHSVR